MAITNPVVAQNKSLAERVEKLRKTRTSGTAEDTAQQAPLGEAYQKMLKSVALIEIYADEDSKSGTAWLIDAENRVFLTNQHVIEGFADCFVYFPEYRDGKLITDPSRSVREDRAHFAKVIDSAVEYDLALIQLEKELPEGVVELEIAERAAVPGEKIHSLAGSTVGSQSLWVYSTGHVRQIVRGRLANNYEAILLESDMATNQGNSGGPVCNDSGEVVAVVEGHSNRARLVSIYVSQESLLEYLADALRCINPEAVEDLKFAAQRNMDEGRSEYAIELVSKAIKLDADNAELFSLRGWCWYNLDDIDSSLGDFDEALEHDRRCADAYYGKAVLAREDGELDEALELISTAIRNVPSEATYFVCRGQIYGEQGDFEKAVQNFDTALRKDPENNEAILSRGYANIVLGNFEKGLADLEQVADFFHTDPTIHYFFGVAFEGLGETDKAIKFYSRSRELDPDACTINLRRLAGVLMQVEQYREALEPLQEVLQQDDEDANALFLFGICLQHLGSEDAATFLLRATQLDPENTEYAEAYQQAIEGQVEETPVSSGSSQRIPNEYLGRWLSRQSGANSTTDIEFNFGGNGRYTFNVTTYQGNRRVSETHSAGGFQIEKGSLICTTDGTNTQEKIQISWRGDQLLVYLKDHSSWLAFDQQ